VCNVVSLKDGPLVSAFLSLKRGSLVKVVTCMFVASCHNLVDIDSNLHMAVRIVVWSC